MASIENGMQRFAAGIDLNWFYEYIPYLIGNPRKPLRSVLG